MVYKFPYISPFHSLCIFVPLGCISMQADAFLAHASVFSGCVRLNECQRPLHRSQFRFWRSEVGEEEGQLPTSLLAITTAVKSIKEILSSILSSQTGGEKENEKDDQRAEQYVEMSSREKEELHGETEKGK